MDFKDVTGLALDEYWDKLEKVTDGLDDDEIRWQPSPESNHILWLVWHCARAEDGWMAYLRDVPASREVWNTEGLARAIRPVQNGERPTCLVRLLCD